MNIPAITGIIRRRLLLNYRVSPEVIRSIIPSIFSPKLVNGYSIAGICLIRLEQIRPKGFPRTISISSENSAHRIAVEWTDKDGLRKEGVFVPRRDTDSRLNSIAGGRLFPGVHHLSRFIVDDRDSNISVKVQTEDKDVPLVDLGVHRSTDFPRDSVFSSLTESSTFFESGCIGYSSRPDSCKLDGLLLKVQEWKVSALTVDFVRSAFFDDTSTFPHGSIEFDHALLMRDISHEWHSEPEMTSEKETANQACHTTPASAPR